eukprot:4389406-Amphidinium_carterae.1
MYRWRKIKLTIHEHVFVFRAQETYSDYSGVRDPDRVELGGEELLKVESKMMPSQTNSTILVEESTPNNRDN